MKAAIVGAGAAGLAAARTLTRAGWEAPIFEKLPQVGGRGATHRQDGYIFDYGATSVAPRGLSIEKVVLEELDTTDLVEVTLPIYVHDGAHIRPGDRSRNKITRYCYTNGLVQLFELMAKGLDVRLESPVERIESPKDGGWSLNDEWFDALVLTTPLPISEELLATANITRPLRSARYRACLSVMLGYEEDFEAPYHALIEPEQQHPLTWLSIESLKCAGHAPKGCTSMVAQLSPRYSRLKYEHAESHIVQETVVDVRRLLGEKFAKPKVSAVHRWRYSQPESTALFEAVNPPGTALVVAGDGTRGGRIEYAYESGVQAAQHLLSL